MFPDIAGLRRNLFRKATGRHPKNLRAHPSSKTGALSVRGKSVNPISAIGILNYKQHACNYKRLQGGLSIAKARVFAFLLRGRRSRSARFAAGALASVQLFGCGVLPRLFFSNSRPQTGARRGGFCRRARARPAGTLFLKGHHKFALWNDTIALRLKKRGAPLLLLAVFPTNGAAKTAYARQHPCAAAKAPRRASVLRAAVRKNKRGKTPRQIGWRSKKTALLCAFLPFSLFYKALSKFS